MGSGDSDCSDGDSAGNVEGENENKTKETKTKEENIMWRAWQDNEQDIGTSEDECEVEEEEEQLHHCIRMFCVHRRR